MMDFITSATLIDLTKAGHIIHIMPRKLIACVDGFKHYKINTGTKNQFEYWKKTGKQIKI